MITATQDRPTGLSIRLDDGDDLIHIILTVGSQPLASVLLDADDALQVEASLRHARAMLAQTARALN